MLNWKQSLMFTTNYWKKTIREAKKNYYENQFQSYKSDIRKTWGIISEILSKKHRNKSSIKSIVIDGKTIKGSQQIAEKFNDFFLNIGTNLAASLETNTSKTHRSYLNSNILTSFGFNLVDEDHINKIMKSLKNKTSSDHDGISIKLLKYLSPALLKPLTLIINQSLMTGLFPEKLKIAKVQSLFKKGDEEQIENYRPISLVTSISKVFEKVVFLQLTKYFQDNGLFYDGQYGFRENHSTEMATVELLDRIISALDDKQLPISIYMDLSKAFDTLNHDILLDKLSYYGVDGTALQWFDSYLSNRSMYVEIDNMKSSVRTLTTGVPQGSILGPLLFLIYMNDISNSSNLFKFILFADDTNLFSTIEYTLPTHTSNVNELLNNELANIYEWLTVNRLSLNLTKTKYMIFHPIQKDISSLVPTVIINGIQIEKVHNFNFLGVCLDSNLKWDGHIKLLASKLGKYSGILNKLKRYIPIDILRILYCSMVNSHLNYAILSWGFACSRLKKMQKRIIRIITCSKYNAHTSPLFKSLRILTLDDMLRLNTLKFYYKYLHNELPPYFYSFNIREQGDRHTYDTRNSGQLQVEMTRTEYADKRLRIYLPTLVNDTPTNILAMITTHCLQDFTKNVKHYLIEQYEIVCSIPDCYICQRT